MDVVKWPQVVVTLPNTVESIFLPVRRNGVPREMLP